MPTYSVEPWDPPKSYSCDCHGLDIQEVTGGVYRDGDAYAIYKAQLYTGHPETFVAMVIGVGNWGEGHEKDRRAATFFVKPSEKEIQFTVKDPQESPWANSTFFGRMFRRQEFLASSVREEFFHIADHVVAEDSRVHEYLSK
jgi:hypothetical protein